MTAEPLRHLLGTDGLDADTLVRILDLAEHFRAIQERPVKKVPTLRGRLVVNVFAEPSTRTRLGFEVAEKRLSADNLNFSASGSSLSKGETLLDTVRNLQAMAPDALVVRHGLAGVPHLLARHVDAAVVNAGDGAHEHPTQALLDLLTLRRHKGPRGAGEPDAERPAHALLRGVRVAIVGDVAQSRVARSNLFALRALGAEVRLAGPATMLPAEGEALGATLHRRVEPAIEGADAVMMLRIQRERASGGLFPDEREYFRCFGLDAARLSRAAPDAIVMHPGPMNRLVEIAPEVADGTQNVILEQVTNGVAVRMAVLYLLLVGDTPTARDAEAGS